MPVDFELRRETRIVYSRGWGALTDADLFGHQAQMTALLKSGVLGVDWGQLWDFTAVDNLDGVTSAGVRRTAEENPWPRFTVRAVVVATDEQFGLVRMYQALGDPKTEGMGITRSIADADAFIARERIRLGIAI